MRELSTPPARPVRWLAEHKGVILDIPGEHRVWFDARKAAVRRLCELGVLVDAQSRELRVWQADEDCFREAA